MQTFLPVAVAREKPQRIKRPKNLYWKHKNLCSAKLLFGSSLLSLCCSMSLLSGLAKICPFLRRNQRTQIIRFAVCARRAHKKISKLIPKPRNLIRRCTKNYLSMPVRWRIATCCLNVEQNLRLRLVIEQIGHSNVSRHRINAEESVWIARVYWITNGSAASC